MQELFIHTSVKLFLGSIHSSKNYSIFTFNKAVAPGISCVKLMPRCRWMIYSLAVNPWTWTWEVTVELFEFTQKGILKTVSCK